MMTMTELAELFQISRSHAYELKKEQDWPHHQFGKQIRFSAEDVEAIRAMNRKPARRDPRQAPRIGVAAKRSPKIGNAVSRS